MNVRRVVDDGPGMSLFTPSLSSSSMAAASTWLLQTLTSSHDRDVTSPPVAESGFAAALRKLAQQRTSHVTSALGSYQLPSQPYRYYTDSSSFGNNTK